MMNIDDDLDSFVQLANEKVDEFHSLVDEMKELQRIGKNTNDENERKRLKKKFLNLKIKADLLYKEIVSLFEEDL